MKNLIDMLDVVDFSELMEDYYPFLTDTFLPGIAERYWNYKGFYDAFTDPWCTYRDEMAEMIACIGSNSELDKFLRKSTFQSLNVSVLLRYLS